MSDNSINEYQIIAENFKLGKSNDISVFLTTKYSIGIILVLIFAGLVALTGEIIFIWLLFFKNSETIPVAAIIFPIIISCLFFTIVIYLLKKHTEIELNQIEKKIILKHYKYNKLINTEELKFSDVEFIKVNYEKNEIENSNTSTSTYTYTYNYYISIYLKNKKIMYSKSFNSFDIKKLNNLGKKLSEVLNVSFTELNL